MRAFVFILLMTAYVFAQGTVKTRPESHDWKTVQDGWIVGATAGVNSSAFSPKQWFGVTTLFVKGDTTRAIAYSATNQSDSALTIGYQLKNNNLGWGTAWDSDSYSALVTMTSARINQDGNSYYWINIPYETSQKWAWADSARFVFIIGTSDSLNLRVDVGGQ